MGVNPFLLIKKNMTMYKTQDTLAALEQLCRDVEASGIDIAPDFPRYLRLAFAIANSCGEPGRNGFHRLCRISPLYKQKDADKLYTQCVRDGKGLSGFGSVVHAAREAGVPLTKSAYDIYDVRETPTQTCVRTYYMREPNPHEKLWAKSSKWTPNLPFLNANNATNDINGANGDTEEELFDVEDLEQPEGFMPAPMTSHEWPRFLAQMMELSDTPYQRSMVFLGALSVLGCTLSRILTFWYDSHEYFTNLQIFVMAPPASGKGAVGWIRQLGLPLHKRLVEQTIKQMREYKIAYSAWVKEGRQRDDSKEPEEPPRLGFFMAGNNTGAGVVRNLSDNNGLAMIIEAEADTITNALAAEHGHWTEVMRKAYDHDNLTRNRRTDNEYVEVDKLRLSILLCGTEDQLARFIQSEANGLFSRVVFFNLPQPSEYRNLFTQGRPVDKDGLFRGWGERWLRLYDALSSHVHRITLELTPDQIRRFYSLMVQHHHHARLSHGDALQGTVRRLPVNVGRMMAVVALLRALDDLLMASDEVFEAGIQNIQRTLASHPAFRPYPGVPQENVTDGIVNGFLLRMEESDFQAMLSVSRCLYRHAEYVYRKLPGEKKVCRTMSLREQFLGSLPLQFTTEQINTLGEKYGVGNRGVRHLLSMLVKKKYLVHVGRGLYEFVNGDVSREAAAEDLGNVKPGPKGSATPSAVNGEKKGKKGASEDENSINDNE